MSIKSILSIYSGEAARGAGLRHAIKVAKAYDAWLTGVLRHGRSTLEQSFSLLPKEVVEVIRDRESERIKAVQNRFYELVADNGWSAKSQFLDMKSSQTARLSVLARSYDLIVTGNHSDRPDEEHMAVMPDVLALQSGRPVLIVPDGYEAEALAEHAIVAWDGKRAAARAIGDALSILQDKAKVTVLTVGNVSLGEEMPGGGIMTLLERHGINASHLHKNAGVRSTARVIEETARDLSAKLIVMGAFEHSKFAHDLFGGVTTEILKTASVPVFMSH